MNCPGTIRLPSSSNPPGRLSGSLLPGLRYRSFYPDIGEGEDLFAEEESHARMGPDVLLEYPRFHLGRDADPIVPAMDDKLSFGVA